MKCLSRHGASICRSSGGRNIAAIVVVGRICRDMAVIIIVSAIGGARMCSNRPPVRTEGDGDGDSDWSAPVVVAIVRAMAVVGVIAIIGYAAIVSAIV